jgi:lipopolysaccharide/colanic/teichoic acid biosynthesis glycosyltransferase
MASNIREDVFAKGSEIDRRTARPTNGRSSIYLRAGKRCADLIVSGIGIAISSPILIGCACAIKTESCGPVLFHQERVGQGGRLFTVLKFRTMRIGSEPDALRITVAGDLRVTKVGKWLRKTKLDELPQLLNVLRGDMSLIGPRPEVPEYVRFYNKAQRFVLQVKPGITGPASLAFIDEEEVLKESSDPEWFYRTTLMPHKLEIDLEYCKGVCFVSDLQIAYKTLVKMASSFACSVFRCSISRK